MEQLSGSELVFYSGTIFMAVSVLLTAASIILFTITGRSLKRQLEQEYGKPVQ